MIPSARSLTCFAWITLSCVLLPLSTIDAGEPTGALAKYAENRNWVDDTGKFQIGGKLKSATAKEVQIQKTDGRVITVPLAKLSEKDQTFIQEFLKAESAQSDPSNPFAGGEVPNPFAGGTPVRSPATMPTQPQKSLSGESQGSLPRKVNAISAGARPLSLAPGREFWSVSPPVALPKLDLPDAIVSLPIGKPFFAKSAMLAAGRGPTVFVNVYQEGRKPEENYGNFMIYDAKTQQNSDMIYFDDSYRLAAVAPNAAKIAAVHIEGWDTGNDMAIFQVDGHTITPLYQFTVGGGKWKEFVSATFLGNDRLAVITKDKQLTFWDLSGPAPKAQFRGELQHSQNVSFSPLGELMAYPAKENIGFLDTATGKIVGSITPGSSVYRVAMSADGSKIAAKLLDKLAIYNMQDGSPINTVPVSKTGDAELKWVGDFLQVDETVYDVERGLPLWTYGARPTAKEMYDDRMFAFFADKQSSTLTINRLPHEAAILSADSVDPNTIYELAPGRSVRVVTSFTGLKAEDESAFLSAVDAKLRSKQWTRNDTSDIVLELSVKPGAEKEEEYVTQESRSIGGVVLPPRPFSPLNRPTGPTEKVKYRPWIHSLVIKKGNDVLYKSDYARGAPSNFRTEDGESTQAALLKLINPDPQWVGRLQPPSYLLRADMKDGLGKSNITASGLN